MKKNSLFYLSTILLFTACAQKNLVFERRYEEGEHILYKLKGRTQSPTGMVVYRAKARSEVRKKNKKEFVEEFKFEEVSIDDKPIVLDENHTPLDLKLSLNSKSRLSFPDFSKVHPAIVGLSLDLMTIYADLQLVQKNWDIKKDGDNFYLKDSKSNSWADKTYLVQAEDAIDFSMSVLKRDEEAKTLEILIKHVPPEKESIKLKADWMKKPIGHRPNNWLQVKKLSAKKFAVSVGKEIIEVKIKLDLLYGKIIDASLDNTIEIKERICFDETYLFCGRTNEYELKKEFLLY
jgi:hypothetical protein